MPPSLGVATVDRSFAGRLPDRTGPAHPVPDGKAVDTATVSSASHDDEHADQQPTGA